MKTCRSGKHQYPADRIFCPHCRRASTRRYYHRVIKQDPVKDARVTAIKQAWVKRRREDPRYVELQAIRQRIIRRRKAICRIDDLIKTQLPKLERQLIDLVKRRDKILDGFRNGKARGASGV